MTVCIAARSNGNIIGVSDRMLTSGDIQFDPSATTKLLMLSTSIAVMQSGDASFNAEILLSVISIVSHRIAEEPTNWWLVKDVADLYVKCRNSLKRQKSEAALLEPLGLTFNNYRDEIHKFKDETATDLVRDLVNYDVPYTSVIVTGVDPTGAHIYVVDDGIVRCNDAVAFAAIGIGARHAESQFMLAKHAWNSPLANTALLAYIAKKRSEVAPGVGEATDMFTVGPGLGTLALLLRETIEAFDLIYQTLLKKEEQIRGEALREANDFIARAAEAAAKQTKGQQELTDERRVVDESETSAPA